MAPGTCLEAAPASRSSARAQALKQGVRCRRQRRQRGIWTWPRSLRTSQRWSSPPAALATAPCCRCRSTRRNWTAPEHGLPVAIARNEALSATRHYGRPVWKRWTGYHAPSRIEAKSRSLKAPGVYIFAGNPDGQTAEIRLPIAFVHHFDALGSRGHSHGLTTAGKGGAGPQPRVVHREAVRNLRPVWAVPSSGMGSSGGFRVEVGGRNPLRGSVIAKTEIASRVTCVITRPGDMTEVGLRRKRRCPTGMRGSPSQPFQKRGPPIDPRMLQPALVESTERA